MTTFDDSSFRSSLVQSGERRRVHGDGSCGALRVVEHYHQRRRSPCLQLRYVQPARTPTPVSVFILCFGRQFCSEFFACTR